MERTTKVIVKMNMNVQVNTKIHPHLQSVFLIFLGQVGIDDEVEQRSRDGWLGALLLEERRNVSAVHSEEVHRPRVVVLHRLVGNNGGKIKAAQ